MSISENIRNALVRVSLIPKMLVLTVLAGAVVSLCLDYIQTGRLKDISEANLIQRLGRQAREDRIRFDNYVEAYHQALKLIVAQKGMVDYVAGGRFATGGGADIKHHLKIPPWLPDASVMRSFVRLQFAVLFDGAGRTREVYHGMASPIPKSLLAPSPLLLKLSHHQSHMTTLDGVPSVVTSNSVGDAEGKTVARVMIAHAIDQDFLVYSQGAAAGERLVALLDDQASRIVASTRPDILPPGEPLESVTGRYLVTGKSFFDSGASDLLLQFASFISKSEFEEMNASILRADRLQRLSISFALILVFTLIVFWMTRNIQRVTRRITEFSRDTLEIQPAAPPKGDQLAVLQDQFRAFTGEIVAARERLKRQAQELLREKTVYLDTILHSSSAAIIAADTDLRIKYFNTFAESVFELKAVDAVGRTVRELAGHGAVIASLFEGAADRSSARNASENTVTLEKEGGAVSLDCRVGSVRDKDGALIGFLLTAHDITERKRAEQVIRRNYDTQTAINWILHISLQNIRLDEILTQALDVILSIPWLSFESRGSIYLVEGDPDTLVMKAHRGLTEPHVQICGIVPLGKCLCGRAAARGEVQFADRLDDRHEIRYDGITPHGHYCVPIKHAREVLGVINIYLKEGHRRDRKEIEFLNAIADALAGIIQRKRAEEALRESEKRYRTLAEAAHDVIFIVDREGRVQYVNSFGAELFHRSPQDLVGERIGELFPQDVFQRQRSNLLKAFENGESLYVENRYAFSTEEMWLGTWLVPLKDEDGAIPAVLGISRDITERRRFEEEREKLVGELRTAVNTVSRASKEWQDTFDSITDLIAIIDREFTILRANKAFAAYHGLHPRDVVNRKCYEFLHGAGEPIPACPHRTTLLEKRPVSEEVLDKRTNRIFRITTFPYYAPAGEIIGSIHVARDVTDEKERETRLNMSERLAALGQMASGIAHEINNPLASIAGCAEGLLNRLKKGQYDREGLETYLKIIEEEVFRCKSITTGMLSFARKTTYEKKDVRINEMLDRTLEIIGFQGRLRRVEAIKNYTEVPVIHGNEGELRQVFLAVITNALDAMENEGVLTLETFAEGGNAVVRISDTGPGIPPDVMQRIFDPFFTTKSDKGGTGLGLSIARKLVMNHNGSIDVTSEQGKGATFTITLPV